MVSERILKTELVCLLLGDTGDREAAIAHTEGRIRGLVFALTGKDIGPRCGYYPRIKMICDWLGWVCKPHGSGGWWIDWHDEVNEETLRQAGINVIPSDSTSD